MFVFAAFDSDSWGQLPGIGVQGHRHSEVCQIC